MAPGFPNSENQPSFADYVEQGFPLVGFSRGRKGPSHTGWNLPENAIRDPQKAAQLESAGLLHALNDPPTGTFDIDADEPTIAYFKERGIDVVALLNAPDAVQTISRPGRAKLWYRLPHIIKSIGRCPVIGEDGKHHNAFELRCGTSEGRSVQDVLPPSIHPDTGKPYEWRGDWRKFPMIPPELLEYWLRETEPPPPPVGGKAKGKKKSVPSISYVRENMLPFIAHTYENWHAVGLVLGREYGTPEAWEAYCWWASLYEGERDGREEEKMRDFFYVEAKQEVEKPKTFGTLLHLAQEGGMPDAVAAGIANLDAAVAILEVNPDFCPVWYDEFEQRTLVGDPPREWTEADDLRLTVRFQREKGLPKMALETVMRAVQLYADSRRKHIVRDWFDGLTWDGTERIEQFFPKYFGAEDSAYTRAVSRNFWISMAARIYKPGCQCDSLVVLEGIQGVRKSSALRAIGGDWFTEQHASLSHKDFFENLRGKLLVEISEMGTFSRAEVEKVKSVITTTVDRYRPSYGRRAVDHPRQFVFAGTTNREDWNQDVTGGRRFLPIACKGTIDVEGIKRDRDQLFAEAVCRFKDGATWWETPADETRQQQEDRYVPPAFIDQIKYWIANEPIFEHGVAWPPTYYPRKAPLTELTVSQVMQEALKIPPGQFKKTEEMRVAEALKFLRWEKKRVRKAGERHWVWQPMPVEKSEKDAQ